jgi:hypothetical protein
MTIKTFTYGQVPIEIWEFPALILILVLMTIFGSRYQRIKCRKDDSYRFFLRGMWLKVLGGIMFGAIYVFYYGGGDTTSYYECAMAFVNLLLEDPGAFFQAFFGDGSVETKSLFNASTGSPMGYMFFDDKTRMVIKIVVPFLLISGKSYFLCTVLVALATYGGLWRLYRMFVSYFPEFAKHLAWGILFMPSVVFWGSGILKDSFTLAAVCYFIVATNNIITKKGRFFGKWLSLLINGFIIIAVKPYILIILLPGTMVWYFYHQIKRIRNAYFRYVIVPLIYAVILGSTYAVLTGLSGQLGRFAPEEALNTAVIIQRDLKQEYYQGNSFDIGEFDANALSIASKFPAAVNAGLFRPYIWESRNVVMLLSGLENLFILLLTLSVLLMLKPRVIFRLVADHPVILYSFVFSLLFAFMIGITTSNFGALVRFKIPLIPLYMASMMVMYGHLSKFRVVKSRRRFKFMNP